MKTNNADWLKIIGAAIAVLIACAWALIQMLGANEGKSMINNATAQIKDKTAEYTNMDLAVYNNMDIIGDEVANLIKRCVEEEKYVSIVVKTLANTAGTHYNYNHTYTTSTKIHTISTSGTPAPATTTTSDVKSSSFINPNAQFEGAVYKDVNGNVICIEFVQKKSTT